MTGTGEDEEHWELYVEICCEVCLTRGPKSHQPGSCPRISSINKIREQKGFPPIVQKDGIWARTDAKEVKSVEVRLEALEKELAAVKTKVGALESQLKPKGQKRKAEDPPAGGNSSKKQKDGGKKKEEAAKKSATQAEGEKKKKKRKRNKKAVIATGENAGNSGDN